MAEILDALRRDGDSSNTVIGIVILVLLTIFVAPDVLPQLVANSVPFLEEGLPCNLVLNAEDRANHQSLIGVAATNPLVIRAEVNAYAANGTSPLVVRVIIINNTIGTVPFVFNPNQVIVGEATDSSGVGLIFNPPINASLDWDGNGVPNQRPAGLTTFPQSDIKVLGPRQRCVHRIQIPAAQLGNIQPGITQVRAYYRILADGNVQQTNQVATPIFGTQGLRAVNSGYVESASVVIPISASANIAEQ